MIQIAICDDSDVTLQHLNQAVTTILQSNQEVADITLYSNSENLSYDIKEGHFFDLILTDIEMPHINGMELAATIRTHLPGALIIFITAYTKYALDAFELSAFRYIDKEMIPGKAADSPSKMPFGFFICRPTSIICSPIHACIENYY